MGARPHRGAAAARARRRRHRRLEPERARAEGRHAARCRRCSTASRSSLADPAVDAVHVTSPNHLHAEHARAALAAGKHVVCEKPLGVVVRRDGRAGGDAPAEAGVVNAVCFNLRYYPQNQNAAALVGAGGDRRAAVRHRPVPPGLAAARHGLELAPRRRPARAGCGPSPTSGRTGST